MKSFAEQICQWQQRYGRHHLPWQQQQTPYRVWVSEIMLQQTQVTTVIPYFERFMQQFPNVTQLAAAETDAVLALWTGLGYYARARNLHKAAKAIVEQYKGNFPDTLEELVNLPGIGTSTAGAILSFGFKQPAAILDGNVKRVLARHFTIDGWPGKTAVHKELWQLSEKLTPMNSTCATYNQGMMDLGSSICTRTKPDCDSCPVQHSCQAFAAGTQTFYPGKKAAEKNRREESTQMLIIRNSEQQVYLQKRPPVGIWGGLWAFPMRDPNCDLSTALMNDFAIQQYKLTKLGSFTHKFSHFDLHVEPLIIDIEQASLQLNENQQAQWIHPHDEFQGGLPKPVVSLLQQLTEETICHD